MKKSLINAALSDLYLYYAVFLTSIIYFYSFFHHHVLLPFFLKVSLIVPYIINYLSNFPLSVLCFPTVIIYFLIPSFMMCFLPSLIASNFFLPIYLTFIYIILSYFCHLLSYPFFHHVLFTFSNRHFNASLPNLI